MGSIIHKTMELLLWRIPRAAIDGGYTGAEKQFIPEKVKGRGHISTTAVIAICRGLLELYRELIVYLLAECGDGYRGDRSAWGVYLCTW